MKKLVFCTLLALFCSVGFAQGTISDGGVSFSFNDFDNEPGANLLGATPTDALFAFGWFYRVQGQGSESFFPPPDAQSYVGNTATLNWNNVNGEGFSAELVSTITDVSGGALVNHVMTLTNITGSPITLSVFNYVDFDKNGAGSDTAQLLGSNYIEVTDVTPGNFCQVFAVGASAFDVQSWPNLRDDLNDGAVSDFANTGLPFISNDFTGGFQWSMQGLPASGGQASFQVGISANADASVVAGPAGATVPTLGEWGVICCVLALAGLGALRFRKLQPTTA